MLTEILMESLMSMDEDTLDYVLESCTDEEIDYVLERATRLAQTADDYYGCDTDSPYGFKTMNTKNKKPRSSIKDKSDFAKYLKRSDPKEYERWDKIEKIRDIQSDARVNGWASVPKKDREYYVNTIMKAKNDKKLYNDLKKAKINGDDLGQIDSRALQAIANIGGIGSIAVGPIATMGYVGSRLSDKWNDGSLTSTVKAGAAGMGGLIGGAIGSGIIGCGIHSGAELLDKKLRYNKNKRELKNIGVNYHPEDVWNKKLQKTIDTSGYAKK